MEIKSMSDVSRLLINVTNVKKSEEKTLDFRLDAVEDFIKVLNYLNKNINNIDQDDLHLLKNTILIYKQYINSITLSSRTKYFDEQYKKLINDLHESYETLINNEDYLKITTKH